MRCQLGSSPSLINILFVDNNACGGGGAIDCGSGTPIIHGCTFVGNSAVDLAGAGSGSGGAISNNGAATITDCIFDTNWSGATSGMGGAIVNYQGEPLIANCLFVNCSSNVGGGVCFAKYNTASLYNCTFCANSAATGAGVGLYYATTLTLVNTIVAFSTQGEAVAGTGAKNLICCNLFGNAGGDWVGDIAGQLGVNGNISEDPLFADSSTGDLHLTWNSPCRDSGDDQSLPPDLLEDFEGDPRSALGAVDMGADEFFYHLYHEGSLVPGQAITVKIVGAPTLPVLLAMGSGILDPPLSTAHGDLYLPLPLVAQFPLGNVPSNGVRAFETTVPLSWVTGTEHPFQALVGPWGGAFTRLTNLMVLVAQ